MLYNRSKCYKEFGINDNADACLTTKPVSVIWQWRLHFDSKIYFLECNDFLWYGMFKNIVLSDSIYLTTFIILLNILHDSRPHSSHYNSNL